MNIYADTPVRLLFFIAVVACGHAKPTDEHVPAMPEPAWATDYTARAVAGCDCKDEACLNAVHTELAAVEAEHGGMDEAPPSVHEAHGQFDKCWRDGTKDLVRDLELGAQAICGCATRDCLVTAESDLNTISQIKYGGNDAFSEQLRANPAATAAMQRVFACVDKVTLSKAQTSALFERTATAMCACTDAACARGVASERAKALEKYLDMEGDYDQIRPLQARYCDCYGKLLARDVADKVSPFPELTKVEIDVRCP